jgi:YesN/AraC family two-component response regulator
MLSNLLIMVDSFVREIITDFYKLNAFLVLSAFGFIGILISPFFFPFILYGLPRLPASVTQIQKSQSRTHVPEIPEQRHRLNLESSYLISIGEKADTCMGELKPYLKKDFNMVQLSSLIKIPLHHLAYYFREIRNQSFNDYKNHWRIKHAKELILDGHASKVTLETIGSLSGFSSRNTFFTAFKKMEGISPNAFLTSLS